jgi:hypothetical protein
VKLPEKLRFYVIPKRNSGRTEDSRGAIRGDELEAKIRK